MTHTQPFYRFLDFVQDYLGELVPEETFTHSHLSWSSIILYLASSIYCDPWHPPHSIYVPNSLFAQSLSKSSLVYLLVWHTSLLPLNEIIKNHYSSLNALRTLKYRMELNIESSELYWRYHQTSCCRIVFLLRESMLVWYMLSCVCLSVCLSSQVSVLPKSLNVGSCKQRHMIAQGI